MRKWTYGEDTFIFNNYKTMTISEIAKQIKRTERATTERATCYLGIGRKEIKKDINKWLTRNAQLWDPEKTIKRLKKLRVKNAEKVYKDWRKAYMEGRVM